MAQTVRHAYVRTNSRLIFEQLNTNHGSARINQEKFFIMLDGEASVSMPQIQKPLKNIKINSNLLNFKKRFCMVLNTISEGSAILEKKPADDIWSTRLEKEMHKRLEDTKGPLPFHLSHLQHCNGMFFSDEPNSKR